MPFGAFLADVAFLVLRQESEHHTAGQTQTAGHQRHRGGILFAVAHHGGAGKELIDAIVAVAGGGWIVSGQTMREPAGFLELVRQGEPVHAVGHVLRLRLAYRGGLGLADLAVGGHGGHDAGFRVGQAGGRLGRIDGRMRGGVVVERVGIILMLERHAGGGAGHRQPVVAQAPVHRERGRELPALDVVPDSGADTMVVR